MAKFFDPSTGGITEEPELSGLGPVPTRNSPKPQQIKIDLDPEAKKAAGDYLKKIDAEKKAKEKEELKTRPKRPIKLTPEQQNKQDLERYLKENPELERTRSSRYKTKEEQAATTEDVLRPIKKRRADEAKRTKEIQESGRNIPLFDRAIQNIGQGIDEVATGLYAIPGLAIRDQLKDKELADEFLGGYGKSIQDLQRENADTRIRLNALPKDAGVFTKVIAEGSDIVGQLVPMVALGAGIGAPAAAALQGITSSLATGNEQDAFEEGLFGALGAFAGEAAEKGALGIAKKIFGESDSIPRVLGRQLVGRTISGAAGAASGEVEAFLRSMPRETATKNTIVNGLMDFLFYGGGEKGKKKSGLKPTYERALDSFTDSKGRKEYIPQTEPAAMRVQNQNDIASDIANPGKGFYSQMVKTIQQKLPNKVSPEQAVAMLRDPKYGIKADEYDYAGLDELIARKAVRGEQITKSEILQTIAENQPKIGEVVLGEVDKKIQNLETEQMAIARQLALLRPLGDQGDLTPEYLDFARRYDENQARIDELKATAENEGKVKYPYYQAIAGGNEKSYKELLITFDRSSAEAGGRQFTEGHWQTPNVLAHARFDEGVDLKGNKVLRIQEIQSDWHQKGRERGYDSPSAKAENLPDDNPRRTELLRRINEQIANSELDDGSFGDWDLQYEDKVISYDPDSGQYTVTDPQTGDLFDNYFTVPDLLEDLAGAGRAGASELENSTVPDAPFKNTWHELAFKRMLKWAVDNGYSKIVWPTGAQQIDLYKTQLRQNVDKIEFFEDTDGYTLYAEKDGKEKLSKKINDPKELDELVGSAIAEKLRTTGKAEGPDLSIGGQVHKLLYDQKLPQFAKGLVKKTGGKYEIEKVATDQKNALWRYEAQGPNGEVIATGSTEAAALANSMNALRIDGDTTTQVEIIDTGAKYYDTAVHSLTISEKLRDQILAEGQPLYSRVPPKPTKNTETKNAEIHQQFGVPKWNPIDNGGSFIDNLDKARWKAVETKQGPTIYTTSSGMGLINALYSVQQKQKGNTDLNVLNALTNSLAGNKGHTLGLAVPKETLLDLVNFTKGLDEPEFRDLINGVNDEILNAVEMANAKNQSAIVLINLDHPKGIDITQNIRHEEIHRSQFDIEALVNRNLVDFDWVGKIPNYGKIVDQLGRLGYNKKEVSATTPEILAFIGAGQYEMLGLSAKQAANSFTSVLEHIVGNHGVEALRRFNFDPAWKDLVNDTARRAEAIRQQVESSGGDSGRGKSLFDRIRDWWDGLGQADGERGLSSSIPRDPNYQRLPWENTETSLDRGPSWVDEAKNFFRDSGIPYKMNWIDRLKFEFIDKMTPVWKTWDLLTANKTLLPEDNAFYLMRLWMGGREKISDTFKNGIPNPRGRGYITPGGFNWLLEPFAGTKDKFLDDSKAAIQLMISQRTLEQASRGASSPASLQSLKKPVTGIAGEDYVHKSSITGKSYKINNPFKADIIEAISKVNEIYNSGDPARIARIEEASKRYRQWADSLLDYAEGKGYMTPGKVKELRQSGQAYVDLHRIFDDDPNAILDSSPSKVGRMKKLFRKFVGSENKIGQVYTNLAIASDQIIRESDRNEAMDKFVQPLRDILFNPQNYTKAQYDFYKTIGNHSTHFSEGAIKVMNNGNAEYWTLHPEIADVLAKWEQFPKSGWVEKALLPLRILRNAITHSPGFIVRNFLRDAQQRTLSSNLNDSISDVINPLSGAKPWDSFIELGKMMLFKPASLANRQALWQYGGGQAGHYMSSRMDYQARLRSAMNDLVTDRNTVLVAVDKVADFLWNTLPKASEQPGRTAEFQAQYEKARAEGLDDHNANIKAAFESRDLMDFAQIGRSVAILNKAVLFLNPGIQGLRREAAAAKQAPLPFLMRWGMYTLAPALGEFFWNKGMNDEDNEALEHWRQMPNWRKDMFFNFYLGSDRWLTIPKPFTMGVAASLTNRLMDKFMFGNERAMEGAAGSIIKALIPVDDTAIWGPFKAMIETQANYSAFYDEDIVSPYEEKRDPKLLGQRGTATGRGLSQVAEYTVGAPQKLAYALGMTADKYLSWDPRKLDYYMRASFGDFGLAANYTGELLNLALVGDDPKAKSDISWRLAKLGSGNFVRPAKPDQARDVKYVMKKANELFGERAEWYAPVKEAIDRYRESNTDDERKANAIDAIFAAKQIRAFLPEHQEQLYRDKDQINAITRSSATFKNLDKESQRMVESLLDGEVRELANAIMSAKVKGDFDALITAKEARAEFNLPTAFFEALTEVRELKEGKKEDRVLQPPIPKRR